MHYVLVIIILMYNHGSQQQIEFTAQDRCEKAADDLNTKQRNVAMNGSPHTGFIIASCYKQ